MRLVFLGLLGLVLGGCAHRQPESAADRLDAATRKLLATANPAKQTAKSPKKGGPPAALVPAPAQPGTLVNPLLQPTGKVASINARLRFVVLDFSLSRVPELEQRLNVYRQGQKVGEVKISGPTLNANTVADLVAGEAQVGDEVRAD